MSMFYLYFWNRKKRINLEKKILVGVKKDSIDMYVGKKHF